MYQQGRVEVNRGKRVGGSALIGGELAILRRQIEKRFGAIPSWAEELLATHSTAEPEQLNFCVLDAQSIEDLLK